MPDFLLIYEKKLFYGLKNENYQRQLQKFSNFFLQILRL